MSVREWFQNLGPKRKFAIKTIAKVAAVSVPHFGNQLHTLFETAFEDLKDHEEAHELIELTQLVNQRFDQLITQVESRASTETQIESVITRYLVANQQTRQSDLRVIDQHIVRAQESLARLHSGVQRVEVKVDQMGLQLDSLFAEISQAEVNAERREDDAKVERSEIKQEIYKLQRQMMVQTRGSLGDSLSIQGDQEKRLIRHLLGRYRALPQRDRESFEIGNDLSVLLTTANMHTEADEVLSETSKTAETEVERGLGHFNC